MFLATTSSPRSRSHSHSRFHLWLEELRLTAQLTLERENFVAIPERQPIGGPLPNENPVEAYDSE
jgi:hypothetical protein